MYVDDSTLYTSATTATEMTATLNKELQLVSEWVARNKLALNICNTKSIVFGTKHSLNPKPQPNNSKLNKSNLIFHIHMISRY